MTKQGEYLGKHGLVHYRVLPNGDLKLIMTPADRREWAEDTEDMAWNDQAWTLFDVLAENSNLEWIPNLGNSTIGGLTSSEGIFERVLLPDTQEIVYNDGPFADPLDDETDFDKSRLWWFPMYMIIDPLEELMTSGMVTFTLAEMGGTDG